MTADTPGGAEDRRRHSRYEILAQVGVSHGAQDYVLELTNISRSGALVHLGTLRKPLWAVVGRIIDLNILIPVDADAVELRGRIVRLEQTGTRWGLAVEFAPPTAAQQDGIARLIALGRPQPPPLPPGMKAPALPTANRRRHDRFELLAAVHATCDEEDLVLELTNISHSGALIHLGSLGKPRWLHTGETVQLAIVDPANAEFVEIDSTIVRVEQHGRRWGFGVQFHPLDDRTRASVAHLCALGRPQPPPLPAQA